MPTKGVKKPPPIQRLRVGLAMTAFTTQRREETGITSALRPRRGREGLMWLKATPSPLFTLPLYIKKKTLFRPFHIVNAVLRVAPLVHGVESWVILNPIIFGQECGCNATLETHFCLPLISTNSSSFAILTKPLASSAERNRLFLFTSLIATCTKICTKGRSSWLHSQPSTRSFTLAY